MQAPQPYDENKCSDKFWYKDPCDEYLPSQKGFITDLVYHLRGTEVPTMFSIWSAVWAISSIVKREAWVDWKITKLFPNFYIIILGPAGLGRKSTAISVSKKLLKNTNEKIVNKNMREIKKLNIIEDKTTPEGLLEAMEPGSNGLMPAVTLKDKNGKPLKDKSGRILTYHRTGESSIISSELSSLLGKQKYNEHMIQLLLSLYDQEEYQWRTAKRGLKTIPKLCTNLIAATTPSGFTDSIPEAAIGDGFLSRTIIAHQEDNPRMFPMPIDVFGAPDFDELSGRLSWIGENTVGHHKLTPEAWDWYCHWYKNHKRKIKEDEGNQGVRSRLDIHLIKLALVMKAQRYSSEAHITRADLYDASKLLRGTMHGIDVALKSVSSDISKRFVAKLEGFIRKKGKITRKRCLQSTTLTATQLNAALDQLAQEGKIQIYRNGRKVDYMSKQSNEEYEWLGGDFKHEPEEDE